MAEVNDVFDKITDEQSFFDPTKAKKKEETKKWEPIREGDYLGHITDVETRIKEKTLKVNLKHIQVNVIRI